MTFYSILLESVFQSDQVICKHFQILDGIRALGNGLSDTGAKTFTNAFFFDYGLEKLPRDSDLVF